MDDLDRLAFRLARTARDSYPELLTHGFSLTDLEERLLPFREARRQMADGAAQVWEATLLRLVSGERNYLSAEPALQEACKRALSHPSPSVSLVRTYATSTLMLGRSALRMSSPELATSHREAAVQVHTLPVRGCRHCGGRLPDSRRVTFCPHCGLDLSKRQCPACSTELDMHWRFCVTCGRGADGEIVTEQKVATG